MLPQSWHLPIHAQVLVVPMGRLNGVLCGIHVSNPFCPLCAMPMYSRSVYIRNVYVRTIVHTHHRAYIVGNVLVKTG